MLHCQRDRYACTCVSIFYLVREIGTSIVETFLTLPSSDCTVSEPSLIGPILYPSVSIRFTIICATSTALVMLFPLAFITTVGSFANCTRVAVTYVMSGFLPMNISLLEVLCLTELVLVDIVRDDSARYNITFIANRLGLSKHTFEECCEARKAFPLSPSLHQGVVSHSNEVGTGRLCKIKKPCCRRYSDRACL